MIKQSNSVEKNEVHLNIEPNTKNTLSMNYLKFFELIKSDNELVTKEEAELPSVDEDDNRDDIIINNYNKMIINRYLLKHELPKSLELINTLFKKYNVTKVIQNNTNDDITLLVDLSQFNSFKNEYGRFSPSFNQTSYFNASLDWFDETNEYFRITIRNKVVREQYVNLDPIYEEQIFEFRYPYYFDSIILDVNDVLENNEYYIFEEENSNE